MSPRSISIAVGIAILLAAPLALGNYGQFILATIMVYTLVALGLNILIGMGGQISIGHVGFWALGAYASAVVVGKLGFPFLLGVIAGGAVAALFGALVALSALRVQGHYLAIATLGFALFIQQMLFEWESLTGGRQGLFVPRPSLFGVELASDFSYYYVLLAVVLLFAWISGNFRTSLAGRSLMALRMSTIAAQCGGISRTKHIVLAFVLSALFTGVSGALYAHLIGHLSTEAFSFPVSLSFLTMAAIGGLGSRLGAFLGAVFLAVAPELLRELGNAQMVIYGVLLILCMQYLPGGLASIGEQVLRVVRLRSGVR